jgi:hypothetical protein
MGWTRRLVVFGALVAGACAEGNPNQLGNGLGAAPVSGGEPAAAEQQLFDDTKALDWISRECAGCHGVDAKSGTKMPYHSAWPLPSEGVTRSWLEVNELTSVAYQTIRHAALKLPTATPAPMPPALPDAKRAELLSMIDWFQRAVPYAVVDADARYGNDSASNEKILVEFVCKKPSTLRAFLSRVTFGAFERPPTMAELGWFSEQELMGPVTSAQRQLVVGKLDTDWRAEFVSVGLRKLATVIGGGPGIRALGDVGEDAANDLKDELYQSFAAKYETAEYADYFLANTVMTSPNTAPLYGCERAEGEEGWKECTMQPPRNGFFTSLGFLNSRPQSFLLENNNHGRVASLFFTLYGEALLAATSGPTGEGTPALPDCLEATDTRHFQGAPRGSAAVPAFGKVCQSCHVSRHMAAGSVLFRPFSTTGQVYTVDTIGTEGSPDELLFAGALDETWTRGLGEGRLPVDREFLTALVATPPKSCIATGKPQNPFVTVNNVGELASQLINNRSSFARGFMRHAQRAFANLTNITLEMSLRSLTAFDEGKKKLPDLVKAYFSTDSFACEAGR